MTPYELEHYLHEHIPLSAAMQVFVVKLSSEEIVLGAPLASNINHRHTVFGGSASALAILAAWSLVHVRLVAEGLAARLVIQRNTMSYDGPMAGPFRAHATAPSVAAWSSFVDGFRRKGRARISISATLTCDGLKAGRLEGDFVALAGTDA